MHTAIELYLSIALAYCLIHLVWSFVIRDAFDDMQKAFSDSDGWDKMPIFSKKLVFYASIVLFMGHLFLQSIIWPYGVYDDLTRNVEECS